MVFAEHLKGAQGRYTVIDQIAPSRVIRFEPKELADRDGLL